MTNRIHDLKTIARKAHEQFDRLGVGIDCGNSMLKVVRPDAERAASTFNAAMRELQTLDPSCPAWKPL